MTIHRVINTEFLEDLFHLPLSTQAYAEFLQFEDICFSLRHSEFHTYTDTWSYIWGSENYTSAKAYKRMVGHRATTPHFKWIWNSSCQPKHKMFFWMLLHDRLNTRNLLRRKTMVLESYNCAVASRASEETLHHLFWGCPFAKMCWNYICPTRTQNLSILEAFQDLKDKLQLPFFMEIIILGSWAIWITRNNKVFENITPSFQGWKNIFFEELKRLSYRMKQKHVDAFRAWLEALV